MGSHPESILLNLTPIDIGGHVQYLRIPVIDAHPPFLDPDDHMVLLFTNHRVSCRLALNPVFSILVTLGLPHIMAGHDMQSCFPRVKVVVHLLRFTFLLLIEGELCAIVEIFIRNDIELNDEAFRKVDLTDITIVASSRSCETISRGDIHGLYPPPLVVRVPGNRRWHPARNLRNRI